jgi:hypothetical protein
MDPQKMKDAYQRLELLDDRLTYKIRAGTRTTIQPGPDQINAKVKDLAEYTLELKDILQEFILAFASRKAAPAPGPPTSAPGAPGPPGSGPPPPPVG